MLFRRLAVFAGGCSLEAAQEVCAAPEGAEPLEASTCSTGWARWWSRAWSQQREEGAEPRFGMLHVIREYALERLTASGEAEALRRAQAVSMLALVEQAEPELTGPDAGAWLDRLEREHDNLRAALGWALERGEAETGLQLVAAVFRFWMVRGHLREGRAWVERLLALEPDGTGAAQLRWTRGRGECGRERSVRLECWRSIRAMRPRRRAGSSRRRRGASGGRLADGGACAEQPGGRGDGPG